MKSICFLVTLFSFCFIGLNAKNNYDVVVDKVTNKVNNKSNKNILFKRSCTATIDWGTGTSSATVSCSCSQKEACNLAYQNASLGIPKQ